MASAIVWPGLIGRLFPPKFRTWTTSLADWGTRSLITLIFIRFIVKAESTFTKHVLNFLLLVLPTAAPSPRYYHLPLALVVMTENYGHGQSWS
ncbi:hypothetical protein P175DRAFT_0502775 [Aspergillus ochraceoroseus IBT 24754]|uniref:Uncharacterized protein n=1 Tax=Aspergillus ochraceoroseus IBT 24754 TaxID=1392256 RepID=A0A2T5LSJ4_9EURO|nr:uncharacterized protein P175DRAFT_0502775 [Aspergillus ochraceoroseus IBT 24754]PTU19252.1 hypothetical protein P175DRAFT_0502775 [Aspergillus ochraceoroseus IBT 24754]